MPQKEVECSGEAARDMASDNVIVFEKGAQARGHQLRAWQVGSN